MKLFTILALLTAQAFSHVADTKKNPEIHFTDTGEVAGTVGFSAHIASTLIGIELKTGPYDSRAVVWDTRNGFISIFDVASKTTYVYQWDEKKGGLKRVKK